MSGCKRKSGKLRKNQNKLKFIYSEKATKFCEISTLLLTTVHTVKSKVEILQNFVAFSEYMNFNTFLAFVWYDWQFSGH